MADSVLDPTLNVKALNEASTRHEAEMRAELAKRLDAAIQHLSAIGDIRDRHAKEMRDLETKRIDAVRESDSLNARIVADRQANTQDTLIRKMAEDREALRASVEGTARTLALQLDSKMTGTEGRLLALERSLSEARGKEGVVDPQLERLSTMVEKLAARESSSAGKSEGISATAKVIIAAVGLFATIVTIIAVLGGAFLALRNETPAAPSVSYVPVPSNVQSTTQPPSGGPP